MHKSSSENFSIINQLKKREAAIGCNPVQYNAEHLSQSDVSKDIKKIYKVTITDLSLISHLKKLEADASWNPGKYDVEYLLQSGQVELVACYADNKPVGYMSLFKSGNSSFFGSLIVAPEARKKGYASYLWQYMSTHATQNIGLHGVISMAPYYARNGFEEVSIVRRITFTLSDQNKKSTNISYTLPKYSDQTINSICTFDNQLTNINRAGILKAIIRDDQHNFTYTSTTTDEKISGYGLLRMLSQGLRLSLYAQNEIHARIILEKLIAHFSHLTNNSETIVVDVPEERLLLIANLLKELGVHPKIHSKKEFKLCTMFFNPHREMKTDLSNGCFGLVSLEVG